MKNVRNTILSLMVFVGMCGSIHAMDLKSLIGGVAGADRGVGLLVSDIEFRKKQYEDLEKERALLQERATEANRTIKNKLKLIDELVQETNEAIKKASGSHEELLKKKLGLLQERQQELLAFQELWKEVDGKFVRHLALVQEILDFLTGKIDGKRERTLYSWKDLDTVKSEIDRLRGQMAEENIKKTRLQKSKTAEKEEIAILKKAIEAKLAEKEKVDEEYKSLSEQEEIFAQELRTKGEVIEQEIDRAHEKIEVSQFKIEDLGRSEQYKDDEIFLLRQKLNQENGALLKIQKSLRIEAADVARAKEELEAAALEANEKRLGLAGKRNVLKAKRSVLQKSIKFLERQLTQIKDANKEKTVEGYLIDSRLSAVKNEGLAVEKELDLLETRKEDLEVVILIKELRARVIAVLHKLGISTEGLEEWLAEFRSKKRAAEHAKKVLKDKRDEITSFISAINKEQEALLVKQQDIKKQQHEIFSGRGREFFEVATNIDRAIKAASRQKLIVERHFSQISELLLRQDEVVNQYNFIIRYLETEWAVGIWKRSPRAISLQRLGRSILEVERFFQDLFWNTPAHLGPANIFKAVRQWDFADILGFILFFLIFVLLFAGVRFLLVVARKHGKSWLQRMSQKVSYVFIAGVENLLDFLIHHFSLLFLWLFVYLHVALGLTYFRPLTNTYAITLFYILSIPALMYLSHRFIVRLKTLNQQLNYLFISEESQWKVTTLIEIFLYATAVLIPLRRAFLEHFEGEIAFPEVSLAAYTLILVVVLLFFFNKEDILRLLSSRNELIIWLRKKVDRFYYPVFGMIMLLLILSNPYIGYSNLAWYLAFAVPASLFLLYGLFLVHYLIRRYSLFFFIKEEDEEVVNKFEHAKAYYGFFVGVTFILLALSTLVILARIWGVEGYTFTELWRSLSEDWVIGKGTPTPLGFVELIKFGMFVIAGLIISSLIKRFILGKIFEIFRTEPGVQNTVSQILHYMIIILAVILGFTAINLSQYALTVGGLLLVGVGFGLRDQIADYFAGVLVLLERPLEIGHYVQAGEHEGKVHRISARATTLKTARNFFIVIPNRDLISKPIINWGQGRYAVGCELQIMVAYDSNPELVQKVLLEVMSKHSLVLRVPAPLVRFEGFEASALYFYCRCFVSARKVLDMWTLQSELRIAVVKAFQEHNIVIPYQQTVVHFAKDGKREHPGSEDKTVSVGKRAPISIKFDKE